jgi:hypothetical protein
MAGTLSALGLLAVPLLVAPAPAPARGAEKDPVPVQLEVPPRKQWMHSGGYCGECAIQQAALLFGTYVSQDVCRKAIGNREVLLGVNEHQVLEALALACDRWDPHGAKAPQSREYLAWVKRHLVGRHPVLMGIYVRGMQDLDYDHIVLATGIATKDPGATRPDDVLTFNDGYALAPHRRPFASLPDGRAMAANGTLHAYCIPDGVDFGCAVTGIRDDARVALPVRLALDGPSEPDVARGEKAGRFQATVTVGPLAPGARYVLVRYDDYRKVPARDFESGGFSYSLAFTAASETWTHVDTIDSDGTAVYRCVPARKETPAGGGR